MKAYKEYMDKISVSDALHHKFVSCAKKPKPSRSTTMIRRYAGAFACVAVILLGVVTGPRLLRSNVSPTRSTPSVLQPGTSVSSPGTSDEYALIFNKASRQLSADKSYIPGHFWQELTSDDVQAIFPGLTKMYTVTATANFRGNGTLLYIDAHAASVSGCKAYIQVASGEITPDYVIEGEVKTSDILGVTVTTGYFEGKNNITYFASFELSGVSYYVELAGNKAEKEELPVLLGLIIKGGAADLGVLDPVIPELREDVLDLNEARADADFGAYLPPTLPNGFVFENALRFINQEKDFLSVLWIKGMSSIHWRISTLGEDDKVRITSVPDTQNYDLSLYLIPRADSVPDKLREIVNDPIFRSEELTLEAVRARSYEISDAGDEPGCRMRFGVLYGNILVEINVKGATPESMFQILQQIRK